MAPYTVTKRAVFSLHPVLEQNKQLFYDYDSSAILAKVRKSNSPTELLLAFSKLHQHLTDPSLSPSLQNFDNE